MLHDSEKWEKSYEVKTRNSTYLIVKEVLFYGKVVINYDSLFDKESI